jgi:LysR family glycine cleavage system transcriptional activator
MAQALPSLVTLRAFATAGRLESLREAARVLNVTPSAISHQVRALETWVGAPLFERHARRVQLTPVGARLSAELNEGFQSLEKAVSRAAAASTDTRLRISALPLFTSVWLAPRLHGFEIAHPGLSIEIDTANRIADLDREEADIGIRNITTPTTGLTARKLLDLRSVVLCAPETAARLKTPADLAGETLIHISARPGSWAGWLKSAGLDDLKPRSNLSFDAIPPALEAAAQGRGVVLGLDPLVRDAPAAARLSAPFGPSSRSAGAYFVVHRRADRARPIVAAFVDWIVREMRTDARRLSRLPLAGLGPQPPDLNPPS